MDFFRWRWFLPKGGKQMFRPLFLNSSSPSISDGFFVHFLGMLVELWLSKGPPTVKLPAIRGRFRPGLEGHPKTNTLKSRVLGGRLDYFLKYIMGDMSVFGGCNTFWLLLPCRIFLKKKRSWHASTWFSPFPADAIAELQTQRLPWPPVIQRYMVLVYRSSCIIQQSSFIVCFGRHQNPIKCYQSVNMQFAASMSTAKKIHEKIERNLGNVWKLHWKKTSFHSRPQPYFDPMLQRSLRLQGIASDGLGTYIGPKRLTIPTSKRHQKRLEVWQRPEVFCKQNQGPGALQNCAAGKTLKMSEKSLCLEANIEKPNVRVSTYTMNVHECQVLQIFAWVPGEFNDIPPRGLMRICRRKELREEIRHESIRSDDQRLRCTAWNTRWIFSLRLLL